MKYAKFLIGAVALASASGITTTASAQSLTTTFSSNNQQNGNIFDITTGANAITLKSVLLNLNTGPANLEFYYRPGTSTGFQNSAAGWTLFSTNIGVASAGADTGSFVDIADLTFAANSRFGFISREPTAAI